MPAAIAFFAAGANLLAAVLLLLLNPRSRAIRWYALFEADIVLWLLAQGWVHATGQVTPLAGGLFEAAVHLLPGFFVATSLAEHHDAPPWMTWAIVGVSFATLPLTLGDLVGRGQGAASLVWQVAGWGTGIALQFRQGVPERLDPGARRSLRRVILATLGLGVPLLVVWGFLSGGEAFFVYAMPLVTVVVQLLIFIGVIHLRFYDVELRSTRRGELAAEAAELQRNALLGELAASFAHEVRNPLTGVRSLAQRLAEDEIEESNRRRYAGVIVREVSRVEKIVADLLGLARRTAEPASGPGPTPLDRMFEDLEILLGARARKADVELRASPADLTVAAAREPLSQALLNLLLNAIEHSPPGGRIELLASCRDGDAVLSVRDEGPGVPPPERDRIFEPLYSPRGGTGLGLAIVRRLADQAGWSIEVDDAPHRGAEFRLRVPLAAPARSVAP